MTRTLHSSRRGALVLIALLLVPVWSRAEPVPGPEDRLVAQMVCEILQNGHVTRPTINADISKRLFQRFLKDLDASKSYFLKSDIDEFKTHETELGDMLQRGDVSFAYKVYGRFIQRIGERLPLIAELVDAKQDYTVKEYLDTDVAHLDYASNDADLRERWRKRIKFDLLREKIGAKPLGDAEAKQKVRDRYRSFAKRMKQLDNYDLLELYLSSLAASLDPHGAYMSPNTLDDFEISMRLRLEGIGALLREENGNTIVVEIVPGGAAAKDGRLKANDKIIAVAPGDDKFVDVVDMKLREAVKLIRGPKGTKVELKVVPAGKIEPVVYTLTRQQIEIKAQAARYEIVEDGRQANGKPYRIGVIDLPSFYAAPPNQQSGEIKSASKDVHRILNELNAQKVDAVVLDMRGNPGGFLSEAVALAGLFIDQGPVVQVKGSGAGVKRLDDPEKGIVYGGPLVVLVSRSSASAAEIVAATLQDYGRAVVVGDSATHGKGTVQAVIDLGEQLARPRSAKLGALRLTMQMFYRVNGDSTQNRGVSFRRGPPLAERIPGHPGKRPRLRAPFRPCDGHRPRKCRHGVRASSKPMLKARSAERVAASKDFAKLGQERRAAQDSLETQKRAAQRARIERPDKKRGCRERQGRRAAGAEGR